jgi:outer membrane protein OmpA-like peptidoglycan-associated protein
MRHRILTILFLILCLIQLPALATAGDPNDEPGSKDPDVFTRMTGFHIYRSETKEFDRYEFPVNAGKAETVEGRYNKVIYYANEGITLPSGIQIARNYINAVKSVGGKKVYEFEDGGSEYTTLRVTRGDKDVWAQVSGGGNGIYEIRIVERQLMKQAVSANADALSGSIRDTGRAAVYGIYFDTDKADLKPASDPALAEIVKLLKKEPGLKLYVVGHTDNVGAFAHNVRLSQDRAAAVVKALVTKHKIASSRLTPFGAGPTAPVASNTTDEGRAKNRRVDLVAQ